MEGNGSARPYEARERTHDRDRIGNKLKNEATHHGIEGLIAGKLVKIALHEAHIVQSRFDHASAGTSDRMRVLFHTHDFTGRTNQSRRQHCHVSYARAEIQDALTWTDPCIAE